MGKLFTGEPGGLILIQAHMEDGIGEAAKGAAEEVAEKVM